MIELPADQLADCFGLGVAGNFAGHLEQAGEAKDFVAADSPAAAPKGIFPWYVPGSADFLGDFPLSSDSLILPRSEDASEAALNLQIEPEAAAVCRVSYEDGLPARLTPEALAAFNDCSIRRPGAGRISEKKNWGAASKGIASQGFAAQELTRDGDAGALRIASFLRRGDACFEYGIDSPLAGYSYFGEALLSWIVDRLQGQKGGDSPLEDVGALLTACGRPERIVIGLGATRYTYFGEREFLRAGDESIVILYDDGVHSAAQIANAVSARAESGLERASVLTQLVARSD